MTLRPAARRLGFGLLTLLGLAPRGFFIPYRYAGSVRPGPYPALEPFFAAAAPDFEAVLAAIAALADDLETVGARRGPARFDQGWFPRLDAAAAYAILRQRRPDRAVEIGSGHSTRFLAAAIRDGALPTRLTAIDPAPRASLAGLGIAHEPRLLADADPALLADLGPGDVLFVDSSHVAMPGTDLDRIVGDVLPRLRAGTLVHLHDITLPDAYPPEWAWRGYNESVVAAALIGSGGWRIVFSSHWVATRWADRLRTGVLARLPLPAGAHETSLWLEKT